MLNGHRLIAEPVAQKMLTIPNPVNDVDSKADSTRHQKVSSPPDLFPAGDHLPPDMITEILSRLQAKTLCKFKSVSKPWLQILSQNNHFFAQHLHHSKKNPILLFKRYSPAKAQTEKEVMVDFTGIDIQGHLFTSFRASVDGAINTFISCGPLVLLCCSFQVYICNPGTQQLVPIPLSRTVSRYNMVGFGNYGAAKEYFNMIKIVHLFYQGTCFDYQNLGCEVFCFRRGESIGLGEWRRIEDCPYRVQTHGKSVCVDGHLYWMVSDEATNEIKCILSFDLMDEEFDLISYPKVYSSNDQDSLFITGQKGSLCLVDNSVKRSLIDVWLLKDRRRKFWVKEFSIDLGISVVMKTRGVVPYDDDDEGGGMVIKTEKHGLIYYETETKKLRRINTDSQESYKWPCLYYDGLFSLHL